jgi:(E)-2-((N-methylformamido)methylene)succinate hydrolase
MSTEMQRTGNGARGTWPLHVDHHGAGPDPVVLLHGLGGSGRSWDSLVASVAGPHRFYAPDLLGFGRSPWPRAAYTVDEHLAAVDAAVFARIDGAAHVVGHSLGAVLALEQAARAPASVRSLTLLALPYFDDETEARAAVQRATFWGRLLLGAPALAWLSCQCICRQRWLWGRVLPPLMRSLPRAVVEDGMKHTFQSISTTLARCILERRLDAAADAVARAGIPVRIIAGEDDPLATPARAARYAARHGNAVVDVVPHAGHMFMLEAVDVAAVLLDRALAGSGHGHAHAHGHGHGPLTAR